MINILKFNSSNNYNYSWGISSKAPYALFDYLDELMLIYSYKLPNLRFDKGDYIHNKFQCKDPDKIIFDKLKGRNLFLLHIDIWKNNLVEFKKLIDYCTSENIDIWICMYKYYNEYFKKKNSIIEHIDKILTEYENIEYDLTNHSSHTDIKEICKPIIRDIQLNKLL
jgi:hypothetical protein